MLWKRVGEASIKENMQGRRYEGRYKGRKGFYLGFRGGAGPANMSVKRLLPDGRFMDAVIDFLKTTKIRDVKSGVL